MDYKTSTVILARVSSKAQEDEGYSLDSQLKLLYGYCESKGLKVTKVFKIAETASKEQSRKIFHELLRYLHEEKIYHLTVEKTDRLTRNFRDALAIDDWLEQDDARRLHAVKENLLLHKEAKSDVKFMWNIHLAVAKKFADNLREEAMKGWAEKLAQGWLPSVPPPGYMTITRLGKRVHVVDPKTKALIKRMFSLYLEPSQTIVTITKEMSLIGIHTRKGRPYSKSNVQKILTNPFYIGINRFNHQDYPGAQEPLITKSVYSRVQVKMHDKRPLIQKKHNPVFKNLIYCYSCGKVITWQLQKGRYYGTCQRLNDDCREKKLLREDQVEVQIMAALLVLVNPSASVIDWLIGDVRSRYQELIDERDASLSSINGQIGRLKRMRDQLYDDKLSGEITREKYDAKRALFETEITSLKDEAERLDVSVADGLEQRITILKLSQDAAKIYPSRTPEQKRLLLTKLFHTITHTPDGVSVKYTNFARAIADRAIKSRIIIGGEK